MLVPIAKYGHIPFEFLLGHQYAGIGLLAVPPRQSGDGPALPANNIAFVPKAVRDQSQQDNPEPGDVGILQRGRPGHERQGEHRGARSVPARQSSNPMTTNGRLLMVRTSGGMAPPRRPYRPTGRMYAKQRGAYMKLSFLFLCSVVFLVAGPSDRRNTDQNTWNEIGGRREG